MKAFIVMQENNNIAPRRVWLGQKDKDALIDAFHSIVVDDTTVWAHLICLDTGEIVDSYLAQNIKEKSDD